MYRRIFCILLLGGILLLNVTIFPPFCVHCTGGGMSQSFFVLNVSDLEDNFAGFSIEST
jgi:hypothetical protein